MTDQTVALCTLYPDEEGTVVALEGGCGFVSRLVALGFTPGAKISVVRNHGRGPLIVSVLDTQIALGRGEALRIHVRPSCPDGTGPLARGRHRHGKW